MARGEAGEAIGKIAGGAARFEGYTDAAATEKKILRDVFKPGDAWVRSGDLMRQDAQGFFYFVDRIGDTFRWKGENVATTEVAAVGGQRARRESGQYLWRGGARPRAARPAWRRWKWTTSFDLADLSRPYGAAPARLCAAAVPAHRGQPGHHRNLQAEEAAAGAGRLRSGRDRRSALCRLRRRLCGAGCRRFMRGSVRA